MVVLLMYLYVVYMLAACNYCKNFCGSFELVNYSSSWLCCTHMV